MKRITLFIALVISGILIQAQVQVVEKEDGIETVINLNEQEELVLIQMVGMSNFWGTKVTISIDYGQEKDYRNDSYIIDNVTGEKRKFNSMIESMNYLEKYGWAYLDAYTVSIGNQLVYHYIFKKITIIE